MNEGSSDTGVLLLLAAVFMAVPMAMSMSRLMEGQPHSVKTDKAQGLDEVSNHSLPIRAGLPTSEILKPQHSVSLSGLAI